MSNYDEVDSHYLHDRYRVDKTSEQPGWGIQDADYNVQSGCLFGETENETLEKQGWIGSN